MKTGRGVATVGRRRLFAWLLPFTLLAGFVSGSTPAHATFPGASGSIAFMKVVGNGTQQLFTIEPDGSDEQQLTDFSTASIESPDWSPDGSKIAFDTDLGGNVHIYVVNADGSGLTQITSGDGFEFAPSWSPDGTKMAIDAAVPDLPEGIFIVDLATGALTQVTANPYGIFDTEPSYSPDGTRITFTRIKKFQPHFHGGQTAVFVVNVDGSNLRQLTPWGMDAAESDWSPDGSKIAFNDADERIKTASIYVMNADGTSLTKITHDENEGSFRPSWSPQGDRIVFTRIAFGPHGGPFDLYTMNPDGTDITALTQTPDFENQADWGSHP
jgi:Tol biopolymer transport system component